MTDVLDFPDVLAWLAAQPTFVVVQIGAFVGATDNDPLHAFLSAALPAAHARGAASTAVLVEPVADYFAQLQRTYAGVPGVRCEHAAIAEAAGTRDFYRLAADPVAHGLPAWLSQLGSLRADRMTALWDRYERGHLAADSDRLTRFYRDHQVVEPVTCLTFAMLLERHGLTHVDLLQIDAEGYDYEILRTVDFQRVRPTFINYERVLLHDDEPACRAMLEAAGYALTDWCQNTLCVLTAPAAAPCAPWPRP
jgi:FkbM family methyltransferase